MEDFYVIKRIKYVLKLGILGNSLTFVIKLTKYKI